MNNQKKITLTIIILIGLILPANFGTIASQISNENRDKDHFDSKLNEIFFDIDQDLVESYLRDIVSFGPRMTGTYACQKAGEYIKETFESLDLKTSIQNWTSFGNRYNPRWFSGFNVIGTLEGKDPNSKLDLVFNAHYDSVKVSPGADDDGSGVAAVLAAADALHKHNFSHTIHFVCFSGEEQGLLGSKAYGNYLYEHNEDKAIIEFNADGIGYATSETIDFFRLWGTEDVQWLMDDIRDLNTQFDLGFTLDNRILPEDRRGGSDYFSFVRYGFDAIAFFEGSWNPHWHSEDDTIEMMNLPYFTRTTKLIATSIAFTADEPLTHPFVYIESPRKGNVYFEGRMQMPIDEARDQMIRTVVIDDIWIWAEVFINESLIEKVEFYVQGRLIETDTEPPYKFNLNKISFFNQRIEVVAYHKDGRQSKDWMDVFYLNLLKRS